MKKKFSYYPGWWNGEPALFAVLSCIVGEFDPNDQDVKFHWYKPFVGSLRQVVHVKYHNRDFYIDNYDGTGLYKVLHGIGGDDFLHRPIKPAKVVSEVVREKWQEINKVLVTWLDRAISVYFITNGGKPYREMLKELEFFKEKALF